MTDLKKLRELAEKATPGPYDSRCKEFSNQARTEIWTEFGWLSELPRSYHEPTIEFQAAANPQAIIEILDRLERYEKALRDVGTYHSHDSLIQSVFETAREALEDGK